jgi:hypothetical protein
LTVKVALAPTNVTAVAPVKFVPVMTTLVPTGPLVGLKFVMVGGGMTVKLVALVAVPPGVVTAIGPVVAPAGTVAVICVERSTLKVAALTPLKVTEVAPVKFVPVITTLSPVPPLVGEKLEIVGAGIAAAAVIVTSWRTGVLVESEVVSVARY